MRSLTDGHMFSPLANGAAAALFWQKSRSDQGNLWMFRYE